MLLKLPQAVDSRAMRSFPSSTIPGVGLLHDLGEVLRKDAWVDGGGLKGGMSEKLLDVADVAALERYADTIGAPEW